VAFWTRLTNNEREMKFGILLILTFLIFAPFISKTHAQKLLNSDQSRCFKGGEKVRVLYLHSLDDPKAKDSHFHKNLKLLEATAKEKGLTIYVPRSEALCKNKLCWPQSTTDVVRRNWQTVLKASESCIDPKKGVQKVLGFSNGGFFVNKMAMRCLDSKISTWVSVGSHLEAESQANLCGDLVLAIGRKDVTFKKAKESYERLHKKASRLKLYPYEGSHELSLELLRSLL
jgi:hypothetical protein